MQMAARKGIGEQNTLITDGLVGQELGIAGAVRGGRPAAAAHHLGQPRPEPRHLPSSGVGAMPIDRPKGGAAGVK